MEIGALEGMKAALARTARRLLRPFLLPAVEASYAGDSCAALARGPLEKRGGVVGWLREDDPDSDEEREEMDRSQRCAVLTALVLLAVITLAIGIYGWPWQRAASSFQYLADSAKAVWNSLRAESGSESSFVPEVSNRASEDFALIEANLLSFWFFFQSTVGALFNGDVAKAWLVISSARMSGVLRVLAWMPTAVLAATLLVKAACKPREEEEGKSAALAFFDERVLPDLLMPFKAEVKDTASYMKRSGWFRAALWVSLGAICYLMWSAFDAAVSYLRICFTLDLGFIPELTASLIVDAAMLIGKAPLWAKVAFAVWAIHRWNVRAARNDLGAMQSSNEGVASSLPVITQVLGPVGSGKTTMVSSIAVDAEAAYRDYYLSVMQKYAAYFPAFDWKGLECWVDAQYLKGSMVTRAQIKEGVSALWRNFRESGWRKESGGTELFFGYDQECGLAFHDGAKQVPLGDAAETYAECYFMYAEDQRIATSNYPIAFPTERYGSHFPVFSPADSYLSGPVEERSYSHVFNEDFFRIKTPVDPNDASKDASIDGGVIAMTEGSNERGNRFDYAGLSRKDGEANKVNDGWNQAMRLIRHWFMVDGKPCATFIYDYQRGDSMNAEARDAAEDTIVIMKRGDEENSLPLWWLEDYLCEKVGGWWDRYYWGEWRPNRGKETLANRLVGSFCGMFIRHRQRMRMAYGYEQVTFTRQSGGSNGIVGERTMETYYFIYRKVRGNLFNSAVYEPILSQRSLSAKEGWRDMPTFSGVSASPQEFARENSFFLKDISSLFDVRAAKTAKSRIQKEAKEEGSAVMREEGENE